MVDFKKLVPKKGPARSNDPLILFRGLDRKASHISLRLPQQETLRAIHESRTNRDHVLKMPTGTGKSAVGLLYLLSHMQESGRPAVYLCPTNQLVDQVLAEAGQLGIEAYSYPAGEPRPNPRCLAAEALIICTYDKLFNARTTFNRDDVGITPSALVLDDAHSGVEEVRDAFTVRLTQGPALKALMALLTAPGSSYAPSLWEDVRAGQPEAVMEIPYWLWRSVADDARAAIQPFAATDELVFRWSFIADALRWCRCVVSATGIEVVPLVPLVERVRPFAKAAHRLFMSATLADDSVLVRELGCDVAAATAPVVPSSESGLGERMVLAPSLLDPALDREWVMKWAQAAAKRYSVVALCSSDKQANEWGPYGAAIGSGSSVAATVSALKTGAVKFAAFAQRYDGIDLPDDACRVLILDGIPFGSGIVDRFDANHAVLPGGIRNRTLNRIEQGMGRAVRSNADYAVCVLAGPELASYITRRDVQEKMSPDVRSQLRLAKELAELAKGDGAGSSPEAFDDLVRKCLARDTGWKAFYEDKVRNEVAAIAASPISAESLALATAERDAICAAVDGDPTSGYATLNKATSPAKLDETLRATYLQVLANLVMDSNPGEAATLQKAAFTKNKSMFRPPPGTTVGPQDPVRWEVAARVIETYKKYSSGNGLLACFHTHKPFLAFGTPSDRCEEAIRVIFDLIGTESSRPERDFGAGPDNLALWPTLSLVIEVKNRAGYEEVPKKDAEQLLHSMEWFKREYAVRAGVPVLVAPTFSAGKNILLPEGTRVITPERLDAVSSAVEGFLTKIATRMATEWTVNEVDRLLVDQGLAATNFVQRHTVASH